MSLLFDYRNYMSIHKNLTLNSKVIKFVLEIKIVHGREVYLLGNKKVEIKQEIYVFIKPKHFCSIFFPII